MKNYLTGIICGILITTFTVYLTLDIFVIKEAYQNTATENPSSAFAQAQERLSQNSDTQTIEQSTEIFTETPTEIFTENATVSSDSDTKHQHFSTKQRTSENTETQSVQDSISSTSNSNSSSLNDTAYQDYEDENISISLKEYTVNSTKVYVADVTVSSAEYLKTAFANNTFGKNITATTSEIATQNNAVLAINGDYYGARESGYVIRNGKVYRSVSKESTDIACIYADGTMRIQNTSQVSAEELVAQGVWQAFSFGPALVQNGTVTVSQSEEVGHAMASNPRTAIGVLGENHYLFVVSDGRTNESRGLSLYELAEFMQSLGVECAYNLDGGGSSTMYYQGNIINNPTTNGKSIKEREVSDIVYIG
ncbi:MAG: phosphodiester glycosidase family protein [Clostridia bacterium]|nr:phosphodiester glycosidase family protein [Clostridia bacterium]